MSFLSQITLNMAFLSQKHAPSVNFVDLLNAPKSCKKGFLKTPRGEGGSLFMFVKSASIWWSKEPGPFMVPVKL